MKVLIAEDDQVSRRLLEVCLKQWGYEFLSCDNGEKAWELLQGPDELNLVISDWMMPGLDGLGLCQRIRKQERSGYTYVILLTARGEKGDIVTGLEAGADDYLTKPFNREEMRCRIKIGERIIELEQRIRKLATTDFLTEVLNRRTFMERLEVEIHRATREGTCFSLIMADIDYFKKVNDTYGHQAGDQVLRLFAEKLKGSSRPYDFVGRYGGEEFIAGMPGTTVHQSVSIAERIRKTVEEMKVVPQGLSTEIHLTASFGVASYRGGSGESVDSLIGRADGALYRAKGEGRNRVCTDLGDEGGEE